MPGTVRVCDDSPQPGPLYETHVTVRCTAPAEAERLRRWAESAGVKLRHIVPARGRMREQPFPTRCCTRCSGCRASGPG
ncbi:hypothetical protein GCM10009535_17640 [Streptomyces thermocarboxydovorans]|uniref:Uncharacterized protein n=1 Tax=Streptomyces thermocarboxydovorans TaxID=59298 RepID=A0ABN1HE41_9ACTN